MSDQDQKPTNLMTCGICLENVKNSKQLPCFHTFCRNCMETHIKHSQDKVTVDGQSIVQCPQCRRTVPVPTNGVDGFPTSYFVMAQSGLSEIESGDVTCGVCGQADSAVGFCIECRKNMCLECKALHKTGETTLKHHILVMSDGEKTMETMEICEKHPNQELKFFCTTCKDPFCHDCRQTAHYGHSAIDIDDAAKQEQERLSGMLDELKLRLIRFQAAKEKADVVRERMKSVAKSVIDAAESRREDVTKMMNQMCDDGVKFIQEKLVADFKGMQERYDDIQEDYDHLLRSTDEAEHVIKLSTPLRIVHVAKEIDEVLLKYSSLEPKELDEKTFIFESEIYGKQTLNNFCGMFGFEPLKLKPAFAFETEHFIEYSLIPVSEKEAFVSYYTSEGSALVKYNSTGKKLEDIALKPDGSSRVLKLGREFIITSKLEKKLLIYKGKTEALEVFADVRLPPRGLALTQENQILLCTSKYNGEHANALLVFSERGDLIKEVVKEDGKLIFIGPRCVTVNINGDICVSDKGASCVVILNKDFQVKARYIPPEHLKLKSSFCPRGICCDRFGRILVADGCNKKIHLLSSQGKFIRFLLEESDGINWPRLVSTGPGNKLWVVCRGNVHVYNYLDNDY